MTKSKLTKYIVIKDWAFRKWQIITLFEDEAVSPEYLQPFIEAPTDTEGKGDKIDEIIDKIITSIAINYASQSSTQSLRDAIKLHISTLPKPVEQELIPLLPRDIVAITDEIITLDELGKVDEDRIHKILSKYWVPKQEDIYSTNPFVWVWWVWAGTKDIDLTTTTPQATSVKRCWQNHCIDPITEEVLCWKECFEATSVIDVEEAVDRIWNDLILSPTWKEMVKKHLSSLPIQKKRSEDWKEFIIISVDEREKIKEKARKYDNLQ